MRRTSAGREGHPHRDPNSLAWLRVIIFFHRVEKGKRRIRFDFVAVRDGSSGHEGCSEFGTEADPDKVRSQNFLLV